MDFESRRIIHMGIGYILLPLLTVDKQSGLKFQGSLISNGIEFTSFMLENNQIRVQRKPPSPLDIRVITQLPQPQPFSQILIIAPDSGQILDSFASEAEAILQALDQTWPVRNRQIISCDVSFRCLYQSTSGHAFQEIWEKRLHQSGESLAKLKYKVLGGGLRFVMPPQPGDSEAVQIEVKVESFLRDTKQVFIETQFIWPEPKPPNTPFESNNRLKQVNDYILSHVHDFLKEG